jgi:carboxyl-terminal processing protease
MKPGEKRQVAFTFDVLESLTENLAKVEVSIVDRDLRVSVADKISLPVVAGGFFIKDAAALVSVAARGVVRSQPLAVAPVVGEVAAGSRLRKLGEFGEFSKVALGSGRTGFIESAALRPGNGTEDVKFEALLSHSPPLLEVEPPALSTRDATITLRGTVHDSDQVRDTYIFAGSRKVFYKSNRKNADLKGMTFEHQVQLQPGVNIITVVSRESEDVATARTLVVRRDGPDGEVLPTPKRDLFGEDWSFSIEDE